MSSDTANTKYLKSLTRGLRDIPRDIALNTAKKVMLAMVYKTQVDTGQAAANWNMLPFVTRAKMGGQKILWGTAPTFENAQYPVLPKTADFKNDVAALVDYANGRANYIIQHAPKSLTGVLVYNPITPGFANFAPGDDTYYEENALYEAEGSVSAESAAALAAAEREAVAKFSALR